MARQATPIPLMPDAPGMSKKDSALAMSGRVIDGDKVRSVDGKFQKIGGWEEMTTESVEAPIRSVLSWSLMRGELMIGFGTYRKLYVVDFGLAPVDVTPIEVADTLTDPFSTTISSALVQVDHTAHGRGVGDTVIFDNATAVGGITIDGTYTVDVLDDPNYYWITHSEPATSTAGPGGGSVDYEYELPIGGVDPLLGDGYGAGGYGLYDYGEPTEDAEISVVFDPRVWTFAQGGDLLYANPVLKGIYVFNPADTPAYQRAEALTNAPESCRAIFITPERFLFALGIDEDPMNMAWPDQDDWTDWTPGEESTANTRRLVEGTRLIGGIGVSRGTSVVLSDKALYEFNYTGGEFIYSSRLAGINCGLVSPMAIVAHLGAAYWLSRNGFYYFSGGAPRPIPNSEDVREFVVRQMRVGGWEFKANAHLNSRHNEIWWFLVTEEQTEPGLYVAVSLSDFSWVVGSMERTSGTLNQVDQRPVLGAADGFLYQHEEGSDANGEIMEAYVTRAPMQILEGAKLGEIEGMVSDMQRQTGEMTIEIETFERMNDPLDDVSETFDSDDDLIDLRVGGRIASVTLRSAVLGGDFRLGAPQLLVKATGSRR